jgi:hypothetical protein
MKPIDWFRAATGMGEFPLEDEQLAGTTTRKARRRLRDKAEKAIIQIYDQLYLTEEGVYDPDKEWEPDTLDEIARIVTEVVPVPRAGLAEEADKMIDRVVKKSMRKKETRK